jgi:hypothetical protein
MKKIPYPQAGNITARYELSEEAAAVFDQDMSPAQWVALLQEKKQWHDLVQFLAHALPVMDAIGWGLDCLKLRQNDWTDDENTVLAQVEAWLDSPNETARIRINQLGQRLGLKGAPSWMTQAVFWSGTGSIVEPNLPVVLPPPYLYSHAVTAAISIAAVIPEWDEFESFMENACHLGLAAADA